MVCDLVSWGNVRDTVSSVAEWKIKPRLENAFERGEEFVVCAKRETQT